MSVLCEEPVTRPTLCGMIQMYIKRNGHQASIPEIDGQKARRASGDLNVNSSNICTERGNGILL
jgi:hypothetical protein